MGWQECMPWTCKSAGREDRQQIGHSLYEERPAGFLIPTASEMIDDPLVLH
jgi:hypothetical protein